MPLVIVCFDRENGIDPVEQLQEGFKLQMLSRAKHQGKVSSINVVVLSEADVAEHQRSQLLDAFSWAARRAPCDASSLIVSQRLRQVLERASARWLAPVLQVFDSYAARQGQEMPSAVVLAQRWEEAVLEALPWVTGPQLENLAWPVPELSEGESLVWNSKRQLRMVHNVLYAAIIDVAQWQSLVRDFEGRFLTDDDWNALESRLVRLAKHMHRQLVRASDSAVQVEEQYALAAQCSHVIRLASEAATRHYSPVPWHLLFVKLLSHALACVSRALPASTWCLRETLNSATVPAPSLTMVKLDANVEDPPSPPIKKKHKRREREEEGSQVLQQEPQRRAEPLKRPKLDSDLLEAIEEERRAGQQFLERLQAMVDDDDADDLMIDLDKYIV